MKSSLIGKILEAFPPPAFLNIPFAGVHITDTAVRVIKFAKKDDVIRVEKFGEEKLTIGSIVGGEINNKEEVVRALKKLKEDLRLEYVRVSLPEERAYLFTAKIPIVEGEDVQSAIESKIEENVPVSPSDLVYDYKLFNHRQKEHLDVVVTNIPTNVIDTYVSILDEAGLFALSLEIESQAMVRALIPPSSLGTTLIINFSHEKVGLFVETYKVVRFTSTIQTKGDVAGNPSFLLQEIKKLYLYWHTLKENVDKPEKKISQIYICGESFDESIVSYLSSHLDTHVSLGNVWTNAFDINHTVPEISFDDSLKYAGAIGLALPDDILM